MEETLSIEFSDIQKIIESNWNEDIIKQTIGEYVLQKTIDNYNDIDALMNVKFILQEEPSGKKFPFSSACCRGKE